MRGSLFALFGVAILLGAAVGPAVATSESVGNDTTDAPLSVSVGQTESITVTVTTNDSAVEGATVSVETTDANATYAGTGEYTTDANGTVGLPTPNETVGVSVTATKDNRTASTTAILQAENASFGQQVSALAQMLRGTTDGGIGIQLSSWVVAMNPGNAPDHAGPPAHAGPPEHAGLGNDTDANETGGPPAHAGGGNGNDNGGGPPDHAGPGDDDEEDEETPTATPD
jgi:hypothetical protein